MKPRVLQLIGSFHNGGSERQAVQLTRLLKEDGSFDVRVATLNREGTLLSEVEKLGVGDIAEYPLTSFLRPSFVRQVRAFAKQLRTEKIDVIHTHDFYTNVFGITAAALAGTYVRIASKRETDGMRTKMQDRVERLAFGAASRIVVNSQAVRDYLVTRGIKVTRLELIHNGVDIPESSPAPVRARLCLPEEDRLITLLANLRHDVKNVPMFLRSAVLLTEHFDDISFVIAGEGELKSNLEAMASQLGIEERVYFVGRCDDVAGLLDASYVCVLTSTAEGFSNSILEYMAAGKPVVATNVGGASEAIVDGETGFLVGSNDDIEMAERLTELLNDQTLATKMGEAGRRRVETEFSTNRQLEKTLTLYRQLLAK